MICYGRWLVPWRGHRCHALSPCAQYCPLWMAQRLSKPLKVLFFPRDTKPYGKRPHAYQGRAPHMNQALDTHLSNAGLLAPSAWPTRLEESRLIPPIMPSPYMHDIVLFGWPKGFLSPSRFCSSHVTPILKGKGLMHIKGGHPLCTRLRTLT